MIGGEGDGIMTSPIATMQSGHNRLGIQTIFYDSNHYATHTHRFIFPLIKSKIKKAAPFLKEWIIWNDVRSKATKRMGVGSLKNSWNFGF